MQNENLKDNKGQVIMGRFFSNRELFWNGLIFLLLGIAYDVFEIAPQLPDNWKTDAVVSMDGIEQGWFIQMFMFIVSYLLFSRRSFGGNVQEAIKKLGYNVYFFRKIALIFGLIFINLTLKTFILITFF